MKGLRVGILGAGRSGLAAAKLLNRLGAHVLLSESGRLKGPFPKGIEIETGKHTNRLLECHLIIRSPGVPGRLPILKAIRQKHIPVWSELEFAFRFSTFDELVAITGTNGKTTTTSLVGALFKAAGKPTLVAGNIGTPLSDLAQSTTAKSTIVLEVSSYQLEDVGAFHPTISAILNITPDHLEHHGTMAAYTGAKARIFEKQTAHDICVLNADDAACVKLAKTCPARVFFFSRTQKLRSGIYTDGNNVVVRWGKWRQRWPLKMNLPGPHNIENVLAAIAIALSGGLSPLVIRKVLKTFQGVEHRLEWVRTRRGVRYVNDSKGTNVDSTRVALASFSEPLIVIMGGEGKGSPYAPLKSLLKTRAKRVLLIGEDAPTLEKELKGIVPTERLFTIARAVKRASAVSEPGDIVLLSPACASFDQYKNYEERGRDFKTHVRALS